MEILAKLLQRLHAKGIKLKGKNTVFGTRTTSYIGYDLTFDPVLNRTIETYKEELREDC